MKKIYLILISLFTIYVLLDAFVIPQKTVVIDSDEDTDNSNINNDDDTDSNEEEKELIITDYSYQDSNITITIATIREYDTTIYLADIKLSSIDYLKTALAQNTYGKNIKETTSTIANSNQAILAINGDYYGFRTKGFVLRNGVIYRETSNSNEALVINSDGSFTIALEDSSDLNSIKNSGALQVFSFGPALINDSKVSVTVNEEISSKSMVSNPRTAIGIIDKLHYLFVVSDGRTSESEGLSLYQLANVIKGYHCMVAYNLDGGGSSTMYFNGKVINNPTDGHSSGERKVSDIIYVGY